jgi:succinate-semialdehyde dehydrogenase/glutarate-semialdehyde dehydrogenase
MTRALHIDFLDHPRAYVGGKWIDADDGAVFSVQNPANGQRIATVPDCGPRETERAIQAADEALPHWRNLPAKQRGQLLLAWLQRILANKAQLASLITAECGKPLPEAEGEIAYGASFIEWFAEEGKRAYGEIIPAATAGKRMLVTLQPVGVCAAITPWNFPMAMVTRKIAPALAAGNTVVLKPAEQTPLSALFLGKLAEEAGLPAGVINIVTGQPEVIGKILTSSSTVRHLSFTGSTEVGRLLMAQCAPTLKRLALELGGNAPFVVFDDADLDVAIQGAMDAKFRNAGQTCISPNRFLVQAGIYEAFATRLADAASRLNVGDGSQPGIQQGPLIDDQALAKAKAHVNDAVAQGAKVLTGGQAHALGGTFFMPTVLADATPTMRLAQEETFAPIAPLFRFHTEEEALALANSSIHGLAAYLFTRDVDRVVRAGEALAFGMVGINTGILSSEAAPFGGIKQSGQGREGSRHGLMEYLDMKYLCLAIQTTG